jgi:hypothetical protein
MPDNVELNPGTGGQVIATDEVAGIHYPKTKIVIGDDNVAPSSVSELNPLPTTATPQEVTRIGFSKAISNSVDPEWGSVIITGAGQSINQTGGNLVLVAGTTARSETILRSAGTFHDGIRFRVRSFLSQRIVNNNFIAELVDVIGDGLAYTIVSATVMTVTFPPGHGFTSQNVGQSISIGAFVGTGTFISGRYAIASVSGDVITFTVSGFAAGSGTCSVFGWNFYRLLYDQTTVTQAKFDTGRKGYGSGDTTITILTTNSPGHIAIITGNDLQASISDQLVASATTIRQLVRGTRVENVPDDVNLRIQIRVLNGTTAPASSTTWTIGFISLSHYKNQDVTIQDVRPMSVMNAMPVEILRSVAMSITGTLTANATLVASAVRAAFMAAAGIWWDDSVTNLGANATFTGTLRDLFQTATATAWANAATYGQEFVVSAESDVTGTLWIEASRDNGTTWRRVKSVATVAVTGGGFYAEIVHRPSWRYIRVGYTNGAGAQARFTINSVAKAL